MRKLSTLEIERKTIEEFRTANKRPITIVLDNVRSLHNVGAVFRTADAFLIEEILLCGITATPPSTEIHKTALGAEDAVAWQYFKQTEDAVAYLRERDYLVYSIEQAHGSIFLQDFKIQPNKKYALVLGNEVKGVKQTVVDLSDGCIEIPQWGTKHSLNVSVAAGIVMWQML